MKSVRYLFVVVVILTLLCIASYLVAAPYAISPFFSSLLMMALPLGLGLFLYRRLKADWRVFGLGMLTFLGSQVLLNSFNNWTYLPLLESLGFGLSNPPGSLQLGLFAFLIGLSSGVFAETARYIVYSRWMEKARTWKDGLMFGAGHGGVEALIIGVFALLNFLNALTARNGDLSQLTPEQFANAQLFSAAYWNNPWHLYLLPLIGRISAIIFHLAAAVLVLQAFTRRSILWYFAAVLMHASFNALGVFAQVTWGDYIAEALLLLATLFSLWLVFALRTDEDKIQIEATSTTEKLEEYRYD